MVRWVLLGLLWALPVSAQVGVPSLPTITNGYGTLTLSNTNSTAVSTASAGPNANAWVMPLFGNLVLYVQPGSAAGIYVCPLGGSFTSSNGFLINPGQSFTVSLGGRTTSPTVAAVSTATVMVGW